MYSLDSDGRAVEETREALSKASITLGEDVYTPARVYNAVYYSGMQTDKVHIYRRLLLDDMFRWY